MLEAYAVACEALPAYAHRFSPRKFTQHQLFALLVLKTFLKLDYRGVVAVLADAPTLGQAIGLSVVPHYTTLQKAAARLLENGQAQQLLDGTVERCRKKTGPVELAAVDSTGFDTSRASRYYVKRRKNCTKAEELVAYSTFPKLEMVVDTATHLILCAFATVGPMVDVCSFRRLLFRTLRRTGVTTILADAGYDSESNHRFARDGCGVLSVIPAKHGRRTDKLPPTGHRRKMKHHLDARYRQRPQVETVVSMLKRNLGPFVAARTKVTRDADVMLRVLTHNLALLLRRLQELFYGASDVPLSFSGD